MDAIEIKVPLKFGLVDFLKFQLGLTLPNSNLSDAHKTVLVYYYLHSSPITELVKDGHFKSEKSAQNYVSDLRKPGLLVGKGAKTKVNPRIKLKKEDFTVTLTVLKDDTK
jgi:hypothetical protein